MIWWIAKPVRAQAERAAIAQLAEHAPWLLNVKWRLDDLRLVADFDIALTERIVPLSIVYPGFFPDAAPTVEPREPMHLSMHQWGWTGELCLEHRPDNWTPDITGAMMIESAHRLLSAEQVGSEPVPSAHNISTAQNVRGSSFRFLLTTAARAAIESLPLGAGHGIKVDEHYLAGTFVAQLKSIGEENELLWAEPEPRGGAPEIIPGWVVRTSENLGIGAVPTVTAITDALIACGHSSIANELLSAGNKTKVILVAGQDPLLFMLCGAADNRKVATYTTLPDEVPRTRLPDEYQALATKKVAIVGCGSLGSKVAVQLARAGVGSFVLVDGDVLSKGNLVRNELDWRAVGMHKTSALQARLAEVQSGVKVAQHRIIIGGQESSTTAASAMANIETCDVIVEATADPQVFNLCAAIARTSRKPICWGEVFGGGVGGVVARLRPDIDPPPLEARRQLIAWYASQGVNWPDTDSTSDYGLRQSDSAVMVADDSDVSTIAAHVSRMVVDQLLRPNQSIFSNSIYVIGMKPGWLFTSPFETWPVELTGGSTWKTKPEPEAGDALNALLADLIPKELGES